MQRAPNKFLVRFLEGFTHKQIFFGVWALIVGGFSLAMMAYYRKYTRRNFRETDDRRLPPRFKIGNQPQGGGTQKSSAPSRGSTGDKAGKKTG